MGCASSLATNTGSKPNSGDVPELSSDESNQSPRAALRSSTVKPVKFPHHEPSAMSDDGGQRGELLDVTAQSHPQLHSKAGCLHRADHIDAPLCPCQSPLCALAPSGLLSFGSQSQLIAEFEALSGAGSSSQLDNMSTRAYRDGFSPISLSLRSIHTTSPPPGNMYCGGKDGDDVQPMMTMENSLPM